MSTLLFIVIGLVGALIALALAKRGGGSPEFPYQSTKYLLTKAERSFYGVLVQAVGTEGLVFAKVRVADVIIPRKGLSRSDWQRAFNAISAKHFDFLICDPQDCAVKAAVELDDSSHGSAKSQKRDRLLNGACESAGLPLVRIKASKSYTLAEIKQQIAGAISSPSEVLSEAVVADESLSQAEAKHEEAPQTHTAAMESAPEGHKPAAPPCPRCGEPMLLRKAKSGSNAGQEFWGCSTFPKCRGIARLNA